jgi:hypothetical protein
MVRGLKRWGKMREVRALDNAGELCMILLSFRFPCCACSVLHGLASAPSPLSYLASVFFRRLSWIETACWMFIVQSN